MRQRHGHQYRIVQSAAHQLFEQIKPLRRLEVNEVAEPDAEGGVFLSSKTMTALYEIHRDHLTALHISANRPPPASFVAVLAAFFMAAPSLRELRLTWPKTELALIGCLPGSVQNLELAVASAVEARAVMERLASMASRLRFLRRIKFHVTAEGDEAAVDGLGQGSPSGLDVTARNLAGPIRPPWTVTWEPWQPLLPG